MTQAFQHLVLIAGGGVAGSEAAAQLARAGILCIVLEQNARPYGKIEDGLPRWHVKLRRAEMDKIDAKLSRPNVQFVPRTRLGTDLSLEDVLGWQLSGIVLAVGAGRDRPLPLPGIDQYIGRGFYYQNPLVYWFNHYPEPDYRGPALEIADGGLVIGGGLASLDVVKILMLETVSRTLAARGLPADLYEFERRGIARALQDRGLSLDALGLTGCTLYYRRRQEDMPLSGIQEGATPAQAERARKVRRHLLHAFQAKYQFRFQDQRVAVGYWVEDGWLAGLRLAAAESRGPGSAAAGSEEAAPSRLIVSSIGSIPEPVPGIALRGHLFPVRDLATGELEGLPGVFAAGNVVTGKGNILASERQGRRVSRHMLERYLQGAASGYEEALTEAEAATQRQMVAVTARLCAGPPLSPERAARILARVHARQKQVGYPGGYAEWIRRVRR